MNVHGGLVTTYTPLVSIMFNGAFAHVEFNLVSRPAMTPDERQRRVLDLAQRLASRCQDLTLDEIDGEFYWRCCRLDFVAAIEALRASQQGPRAFDEIDRIARTFGIPETAVAAHLSEDLPLSIMEPALSFHCRDDDRDDEATLRDLDRRKAELERQHGTRVPTRIVHAAIVDRVSIKVPTATMSGVEVATRVARFLAAHDAAGSYFCHPAATSEFSLQLTVDLVTVGTEEDDVYQSTLLPDVGAISEDQLILTTHGTIPPPFVRVVIGYPWPPAEVLAWNYDVARLLHPEWRIAWGEDPTAARAQGAEVAIRTWAVSLLMAAGLSHRKAMDRVCTSCGFRPIERPGWHNQRTELRQRVPQAVSCLAG